MRDRNKKTESQKQREQRDGYEQDIIANLKEWVKDKEGQEPIKNYIKQNENRNKTTRDIPRSPVV